MKANPGTDKAVISRSPVLRRAFLCYRDGLLRVTQGSRPLQRGKEHLHPAGTKKRAIFWELTTCQALFLVKYIIHLIFTTTLWWGAIFCLECLSPRHPRWLTSSSISRLSSRTTFFRRFYPDCSLQHCNIILPAQNNLQSRYPILPFLHDHADHLLIYYI